MRVEFILLNNVHSNYQSLVLVKDEGTFADYGFLVRFYTKGGFIFSILYEIICRRKYYNSTAKDDILKWLSKKTHKLFSLQLFLPLILTNVIINFMNYLTGFSFGFS